MIEILASGIIIYGNANGVWSPSHPHLYPPPISTTQIVLPSVPQVGDRYIPETPLRYQDGTFVVK